MANTVTITADTFEETIGSSTPTLVDFWAEWCAPCKQIAPVLEELAAELGDKVTIAKLNIDTHPAPSIAHNVMGIPTLIIFKDGVEKRRIVGLKPKATLREELTNFVD